MNTCKTCPNATRNPRNAGRKPLEIPRKNRTIRVTDSEWELVKQYVTELKSKQI